MPELEGEDMVLMARFGKRPAAASLAGRRERETRPVAAADRRRLTQASSTKSRQLNLKVTPEFHEQVSALARNDGAPMVELIERAVEAYARARETG